MVVGPGTIRSELTFDLNVLGARQAAAGYNIPRLLSTCALKRIGSLYGIFVIGGKSG